MNPFTDNNQIEESIWMDLEEHIEELWDEIIEEWNDDQELEAFSLECAFGPEE